MQSIAQYLRDRLDPGQYQLLQKVSRGFTRPLFALDPETGRFECAAELDDEEVEDPSVVLDALCVACELLEASGVSFDPQDPALEPSASSGTVELTIDFPDEDEDALVRFKAMLAENASADAGIHADYQKYPGGVQARIRLAYSSDFDYQRKKDLIDFVLQVAKRRAKDDPLSGSRL